MDVAALAGRLIRRGEDPQAVAELAAAELAALGARVESGTGALLASFGAPRIVLSGHLDVVPPGSGWTEDPFAARTSDGWLHGRGAADMRGACAAMIAAAAEHGHGDYAIALTLDEETTMAGAKALAASGRLGAPDLVVVGEPTSLDLGVAHKGVIWLELVARGKAAHGALPEEGVNAVARMRHLLDALETFPVEETDPLLGRASLNVGTIAGGQRVNVVPDHCRAQVDHRFLPGTRAELRLEELRRQLERAGVPFELAPMNIHDAFQTRRTPAFDAVSRALRSVRPRAKEVGLPFGTEAHVYQHLGGSVVVLGPGEREAMHSSRERVRTTELEDAARVYAAILAELAETA